MNKLLAFAAVSEAGTGVALAILPSLVGRLLLGAELTGVSIPVARVAGFALIALGLACLPHFARGLPHFARGLPHFARGLPHFARGWPGSATVRSFWSMLTYGALVTLYLAYLGIRGEWVGVLLWPAVALHAMLTVPWHADGSETGRARDRSERPVIGDQ
jgi:hypothetical protein